MISSPNQKMIYIDREMVKKETRRKFLYSYTDNINTALSVLNYSAFKIYMYLLEQKPYTYNSRQRLNANEYPTASLPFALSPKAINESEISLSPSSYRDGMKELEEKGYLVPYKGCYIFYEIPEQYRPIYAEEIKEISQLNIEQAHKEIHKKNLQNKIQTDEDYFRQFE